MALSGVGKKDQVLITGRLAYGKDSAGNFYPIVVDSSGNLLAAPAASSLGEGRTVCGTAGTRVQLSATSTATKVVIITAEEDNANDIVVGGSTVVASTATARKGTPLLPGDSVTLYIDNLNKVYLDGETAGEGVNYTYMN